MKIDSYSTNISIPLLIVRLFVGGGLVYVIWERIFVNGMGAFSIGVAEYGFKFAPVFAWGGTIVQALCGIALMVGYRVRTVALIVFILMTLNVFVEHGSSYLLSTNWALSFWWCAIILCILGSGKYALEAD